MTMSNDHAMASDDSPGKNQVTKATLANKIRLITGYLRKLSEMTSTKDICQLTNQNKTFKVTSQNPPELSSGDFNWFVKGYCP
jgi:hypothetical protein